MKKLEKDFVDILNNIENMSGYDGRGQGVDDYVCERCGKHYYTRYKDKGVTPFVLGCKNKCGGTMVHKNTISEYTATAMGVDVHNWVRPTLEQFKKLSTSTQDHCANGGLLLEEELWNL